MKVMRKGVSRGSCHTSREMFQLLNAVELAICCHLLNRTAHEPFYCSQAVNFVFLISANGYGERET